MKRTMIFSRMLLVVCAAATMAACERRPLEETFNITAKIPVKIDWSNSGFDLSDPGGEVPIHRVSLRFFPKEGSVPFDRYLEGNVTEGEIELPVGEYRVVVFNESIDDSYWTDRVFFTDVNDYHSFAANVRSDKAANYPYYSPLSEESLVVEPLRLASWSLDDFTVTPEMVAQTRAAGQGLPAGMPDSRDALTRIVMRPLTYNIHVRAHVQNLRSAQFIQGAMRGFAGKVYMASGEAAQSPTTYIFKLNGRTWDDENKIDGTIRKSFLSFGRLPQPANYYLNLDVVFITGEIFDPSQWEGHQGQSLLYDITEQVLTPHNFASVNINIDIGISLSLPYVEGGIDVGEWEDVIINLQ